VLVKPAASQPNQRWSMLTMVDDCTRECPVIEVGRTTCASRIDRMAIERGLPEAIVVDNGPGFRSRALAAWSEERGVRLEFIQPGKPVQNAYIESFNGRLRDECLNANWFTSLSDARRKIEIWRKNYNERRPHSSLNYLPPAEFALTATEIRAWGKLVQGCQSRGLKRRPLLRTSSPLKPRINRELRACRVADQ
jgi:putative transposase